jgi:hypothetical protein
VALLKLCSRCFHTFERRHDDRGLCTDCYRDYYAEKRERRGMRRSAEKAAANRSGSSQAAAKA